MRISDWSSDVCSSDLPDLVAKAIAPDYSLGSHVAPLGLLFYQGRNLPDKYRSGVFVSEPGSWDRTPLSGYAVAFVPFKDRSEEHTSELQSLMRSSYAVYCLTETTNIES